MRYCGFDVVLHEDPAPARYELRGWAERWLTRPWQPLRYWNYIPAEQRLWPAGEVLISLGTIHAYRSEWAAIERVLKQAAMPIGNRVPWSSAV